MKSLDDIAELVRDSVGVGARGVCGWQAQKFQEIATAEGYQCRIVGFMGHVCNQIYQNGEWKTYDVHLSENDVQDRLMKHILSSPMVFSTDDINYMENGNVVYTGYQRGQYSRWMELLANKAEIFLPYEIKSGAKLSDNKPNVVVRHDLESNAFDKWILMALEDDCNGVRSITYVLPNNIQEGHEYWYQYHLRRLGFGLHLDTTDLTLLKEYANLFIKEFPSISFTIAAHGQIDPEEGFSYLSYFDYKHDYKELPKISTFEIEKSQAHGFLPILKRTGRYAGSLVDNWGVIYPEAPETFIQKMQPGMLYYMLFHPENFSINKLGDSLSFDGIITGQATLAEAVTYVARFDTPYTLNYEQKHLRNAAKWLSEYIKDDELLIDLFSGISLLNIYLKELGCKNRYIGVENNVDRRRIVPQLHAALGLTIPEVFLHDVKSGGLNIQADWVTMLSWESDNADCRAFEHIREYVPIGKHFMVTWIPEGIKGTKWFSPQFFTIPGVGFFEEMGFREISTINDISGTGMPWNLSIFERIL